MGQRSTLPAEHPGAGGRAGAPHPARCRTRLATALHACWPETASCKKGGDPQGVADRAGSPGPLLPELFGGSADLTGSNLTDVRARAAGPRSRRRQLPVSYGVREFGMAAMMNGMALHGGFIPYGGTFMTFSDYSRNAIRMAALMKQRVIHVLTHDSIGLGEDGPTHQPVERAAALRLIPNRPVAALRRRRNRRRLAPGAGGRDGPSCLALSRQALPPFRRSAAQVQAIARGGYVLQECAAPDIVLIATGSEVDLAAQAAELLRSEGGNARRVVPCPA